MAQRTETGGSLDRGREATASEHGTGRLPTWLGLLVRLLVIVVVGTIVLAVGLVAVGALAGVAWYWSTRH